MTVPCGKCVSCRVAKAREWATRMLHERDQYEKSVFITLTYNDQHIPKNQSINKEEVQRFIKRLRKKVKLKLKYYACGEYGDQSERPHYHAIIFNIGIKDTQIIKDAWQEKGHVYVGTVTYDSARYVADYIQKKYAGRTSEVPPDARQRPFMLSSQGIGKEYALNNKEQLTDMLSCTVYGKNVGMPRYYKKILKIDEQLLIDAAKERQKELRNKYVKKGYKIDIQEGVYSGELCQDINKSYIQADKNIKAKKNLKDSKL